MKVQWKTKHNAWPEGIDGMGKAEKKSELQPVRILCSHNSKVSYGIYNMLQGRPPSPFSPNQPKWFLIIILGMMFRFPSFSFSLPPSIRF